MREQYNADVLEDGVILIAGPKLEEKAGVWLATKLPYLSLYLAKSLMSQEARLYLDS